MPRSSSTLHELIEATPPGTTCSSSALSDSHEVISNCTLVPSGHPEELIGVWVGVALALLVGVAVGVLLAVGVAVRVVPAVEVAVGVTVDPPLDVGVGLALAVGVDVADGLAVGVALVLRIVLSAVPKSEPVQVEMSAVNLRVPSGS